MGRITLWSISSTRRRVICFRTLKSSTNRHSESTAPFDRDAHPIVMAVERLALVTPEGDEVRRGEDQIVLADLHAEIALHGPSHRPIGALNYNDEQRGARQIGGGTGIPTVGGIPELRVERRQRLPASRRSHAPRGRISRARRETASAVATPSFLAMWVSGWHPSSRR